MSLRFYTIGVALLSLTTAACTNKNSDEKQAKKVVTPDLAADPAPAAVIDVWSVENSATGRLARLLSQDRVRAQMFETVAPPRFQELALKLKKAQQANPGAFIKQLAQAKTGEPMPYAPSLGVTEAEYKEFLGMAGQMALKKKMEIDVSFKTSPEGVVTIVGLPNVPELEVDTAKLTVKVKQGTVSNPTEVKPNEQQKMTGPFNCYSWRSGALDTLSGRSIRFFAGQLVESKEVIMEVRIKGSNDKQYIADYLLRFPGPTK
jgi:hypothetical protein